MIGVYCSPARISSHLNCRCNHRGKERRRVWVQAGRRDNWWTETSVFWFFVWKKKAFEKSNGWDCCLQKGKKILWESCTCSGGSPLFWLYYNYYLILYSSNGKHKKKEKKKFVRIQTHVFLACLAVVSVLYPMPGIPRETEGLGKQGCRQTAFGTNKARHVWLLAR